MRRSSIRRGKLSRYPFRCYKKLEGGVGQSSSLAEKADTVINSIATGITIGGGLAKDEGAIVGAIVGGLKGIGEVIAEEINEPEGESWRDRSEDRRGGKE